MRRILTEENPFLAEEWDDEKNGDLRPEGFTSGSNIKVWWRCSEGHSWQARISRRFINGNGCPYCSGNKVWQGFNDLVTTHPHIAEEWDHEKNGGLLPEQFSAGAEIRIWWKCKKCGYSWNAVLYSRKNCGCPACANNILVPGVNDLLTVNPAVSAEWDGVKNGALSPESVAANDNRKAWWLCKLGHSWQAVIYSRNNGKGCPYCNKRILLVGFNDLLAEAPEVAAEWDYEKNSPLRPEMVAGTSHRSVWWKCKHGHSWKAQVANRRYGTGCPYCAGKLAIVGENDLATLRPGVAAEWDMEKNGDRRPEQVTAQSHWIVWWRCSRGHSYRAGISHRFRGHGCPYCSGKRPIPGETDFASVHPELLPEWDSGKNGSLHPQDFTAGSKKAVWWRCKNGHSWNISIQYRHLGSGCPYCSGLLAIPGETDFGTVNPSLLDEWDDERNEGIDTSSIKPYSNKKYWWVCQRGHHWRSPVGTRHAGSGCPYCKGKIQMRTRLV